MKAYDSGLTTEVIARAQADAWLDLMLDNWGRWAAGGIGGPVVYTDCASAERHYAIPVWENEESSDSAAADELAGESVDIAWRNLPALPRQVLRGVHVEWPRERVQLLRGCGTTAGEADRYRARELRLPLALMLEGYALGREGMARLLRLGVMR